MASIHYHLFIMTSATMIEYGEPFFTDGLAPQDIRDAGLELAHISNSHELVMALMNYIDTDTLAEFIDDRCMGRV